ncbi:MAG: family 43 glycosylhydrolase [Clostridiales bacterium]|nr:family 43 glycosylhydrolase [Clostridiales bacterium]
MQNYQNKRNPILPLEHHIPDSEAHVMPDGRLYVYGSYDDREDVYCSEKYFVVSTADMEHWTIHDEALNGKQIPWFNNPDAPKYPGIDWSHPTLFIQKMLAEMAADGDDMKEKFEKEDEGEKPALLFAPDCTEKNGKYYLYFCMPDDSEGVAVSNRPEGPFTDPVQLPCGGIDPAVFVDDDGQAYLYWGQLFSHGVKLNADLISFNREDIVDNLVTEEAHYFHEGSSMRKIGDTYYYLYADMERGKPTALGYSTGKSPMGPFSYQGIIIDNDGCDPKSWNNHGSIECMNGQWYVFYHRCSRQMAQHRRLCIEKITILPDGTIPEVKMTSQGVGDPFSPGEPIMGYQACGLSGKVYIGVNTDEATTKQYPEKLTNIQAGDEIIFRYVRSRDGYHRMLVKASGSGRLTILLNGMAAGEIRVENGIQMKDQICAEAGEYELKLCVEEAESLEILEVVLD